MRSGRDRHALHMGAGQLARDFVGEEIGGVIDWQTILATIIQPHACASVGRALTDSLAQTHPPRPLLCRSIVEKGEQVLADKSQKGVSIEDAGFRLLKRVGAKMVLIDFDDQFAVAAARSDGVGP